MPTDEQLEGRNRIRSGEATLRPTTPEQQAMINTVSNSLSDAAKTASSFLPIDVLKAIKAYEEGGFEKASKSVGEDVAISLATEGLGKAAIASAKLAAPFLKKAIIFPAIPYLFKDEAARKAGKVALKYHPKTGTSTRSAMTWGPENAPVHPADFFDTMEDIAIRNDKPTEEVMARYLEKAGDPYAGNPDYIRAKAAQGLRFSEADIAAREAATAARILEAENRAAPSLADRVSEWLRADARIREINSFNNPARGNTFYNEVAYLSGQQEGKTKYIRKVLEGIHGAGSTSHMSDDQIIDYAREIIRR